MQQLSAGNLGRLAPIILFQIYLNVSLAIFAFGPWPWPLNNAGELYGFVLTGHVLLLLGYLTAFRTKPSDTSALLNPNLLLGLASTISILLFVPSYLAESGNSSVSLSGLSDAGSAYNAYQMANATKSGEETSTVLLFRAVLSPLLVQVLPLTIFFWRRVDLIPKLLGATACVCYVALFALTGRNKGMVDIALMLPWFFLLPICNGEWKLSPAKLTATIAFLGIMFLGVGSQFGTNVASRYGGSFPPAVPVTFPRYTLLYSESKNNMLQSLPDDSRDTFRALAFYQSHAYYGLSLALQKDYSPTWGIGHSRLFQIILKRLSGNPELAENSYESRISNEDGWSNMVLWCTTYTFFASDVTFPGVLILMFILGRLLALSWIDTLGRRNPLGAVMFMLFTTVVLYLPMNNVVLNFADTFFGFWVILISWLTLRKKMNSASKTE